MRRKFPSALCATLLAILACAFSAQAASVDLRFSNVLVTRDVQSFKELKYKHIVPQTRDFSCGAAAMATLMTSYFGKETDEIEVLDEVLFKADEETAARIMNKGLSLLDLKNFGEKRGLVGQGLRMKPEDLETLDRPAIVLVNFRNYSHFVVIKGVSKGKVYLADPARGKWMRTVEEFGELWNGILLAFKKKEGETVASHNLEVRPFWSRGETDLLPSNLLDMQFARRPGEF